MIRNVFAIFATSLLGLQAAFGASCSYTLSPGSAAPPFSGHSNSFTVTAGTSCAWSSATTNSWLHPLGAATGNGSVSYTVDANPGNTPRVGAITAGGKTFHIPHPSPPLPLGVGLNNPNLLWTTAPDYPWFTTNSPAPSFD